MSTNGGRTFTLKKPLEQPIAVACHGDTHAWALEGTKIASHLRCGRDWSRREVGSRAVFTSMSFASPTNGWLYSDRELRGTEDGGRTWSLRMRALGPPTWFDGQKGWALGGNGDIYKTADGGRNGRASSPRSPRRTSSDHPRLREDGGCYTRRPLASRRPGRLAVPGARRSCRARGARFPQLPAAVPRPRRADHRGARALHQRATTSSESRRSSRDARGASSCSSTACTIPTTAAPSCAPATPSGSRTCWPSSSWSASRSPDARPAGRTSDPRPGLHGAVGVPRRAPEARPRLYVAHPRGDTPLERLREEARRGAGLALCFGNEHDGVHPLLEAAATGPSASP